MLRNGPLALRAALEVIQHGLETSLEEGMLLEANAFGVLCATDDMREGLQAFLEKRKATFQGS
jgi:enoyl-CoA hydratase